MKTRVKLLFLMCGMTMAIMGGDLPSADGPKAEVNGLAKLPAKPNPLWFWNNARVEEGELKKQIALFKGAGYGGLSILPFGRDFKPEYLSEEYFRLYRLCAEESARQGMTLWLYDEYGFPSGSAGWCNGDGKSRFAERYPNLVMRKLDKREQLVKGGETAILDLGGGEFMASVAMEITTHERRNLAAFAKDGKLVWTAPDDSAGGDGTPPLPGRWRVMAFVATKADPIMDYLDPEAGKKFIELTHEQYYTRMKDYFGPVIVGTFFDEPTLYRGAGRAWTPIFNRRFQEKYGYSPELLYPALWYDIGPETAEARNLLFGFRSELYATAYVKEITDWCVQRGIHATGHQDNEEVVNPVGTSGDLMKCFQYQEMPGIDKIGGNRPAELFYKVVSSAAHNWDHRLVMSETYGAMGDLDWDQIYCIAMDQYTKGVNVLIPHAVWYDVKRVTFKPELSPRHPKYAARLPEFTAFLSRLNQQLQPGRTVNDVAVLYPIASMQAGHYFDGPLSPYKGGVEQLYLDYHQVGRVLTDELGVDFEYLHPEVLDRCPVENGKLHLKNREQFGSFHTLVIPSGSVIALETLAKADELLRAGGQVVFTGELPRKGAKAKDDLAVAALVAAMINRGARKVARAPYAQELAQAIGGRRLGVSFAGPALRNIHRESDSGHVWYFANLSNEKVETEVVLLSYSGKVTGMSPHTGEVFTPAMSKRHDSLRVKLSLPPYRSAFLVGGKE